MSEEKDKQAEKDFRKFVKGYFKSKGFEAKGIHFYKNCPEHHFLCEISMDKSYFGETFYFHILFCLGDFEKPYKISHSRPITPWVERRFRFKKDDRILSQCDYLEFSYDEVESNFDVNMDESIYPAFESGRKFLIDNYGRGKLFCCVPYKDEDIMRYLCDE